VFAASLFAYLKDQVAVPCAAFIVGTICFGLALLAPTQVDETFTRDLDYEEGPPLETSRERESQQRLRARSAKAGASPGCARELPSMSFLYFSNCANGQPPARVSSSFVGYEAIARSPLS